MSMTVDERERNRIKVAKWRARHRDRFREYRREHYAKNKDRIRGFRRKARDPEKERAQANKRYAVNRVHIRAREKQRRAQDAIREKARLATAKWRAENPERARDGCKRYQKAHPAAFQKSTATRRARKLGQFVEAVDRETVFSRDNGTCGICMKSVDQQSKWHVDHVIPLSKGGVHSYDNVQLAHARCNQRKHVALPKGQPTLFQVVLR